MQNDDVLTLSFALTLVMLNALPAPDATHEQTYIAMVKHAFLLLRNDVDVTDFDFGQALETGVYRAVAFYKQC